MKIIVIIIFIEEWDFRNIFNLPDDIIRTRILINNNINSMLERELPHGLSNTKYADSGTVISLDKFRR